MMHVIALAAVLALAAVSPVAADSINIGINIGSPAPPPPRLVVTAPPQLVAVPGTSVFYAPGVSINFFAHGGSYYSFHEGAWFVATTYGGPWSAIAVARVPQPVLAVPVTYYKIPPGHAKKMGRAPGRAKGAPGCPPGLAKQGRC